MRAEKASPTRREEAWSWKYSSFLSFTESFSASAATRSVVERCSETEDSAEESGPRFESPSNLPQGAVDHEVGVAADWAGEVGVVALVQAVVAKRFRGVSGAFQALEESRA